MIKKFKRRKNETLSQLSTENSLSNGVFSDNKASLVRRRCFYF